MRLPFFERFFQDLVTENDVSQGEDHFEHRDDTVRPVDEGFEGNQVPETDGGQGDEAEVERGPECP